MSSTTDDGAPAAVRPTIVPLTVRAGGRTRVPSSGRVVVLSATVGQGHEGAARELARRLDGRVDVEVHDYLDALPEVARRVLRDLYRPTVQYAPRLFERVFRGMEHDGPWRRAARWVCRAAEPVVEEWTRDADVVVATYPLAGQTLGRLRDAARLRADSVTYLTDPAAHALWCHPSVDVHLTVTRVTAVDATRYGVPARAAGPLCAPGFGQLPARRATVRGELSIPGTAPVVLLSAGSLGLGSVPRIVGDVLEHPSAHAIVLCGRGDGLRRRLQRLPRVAALGWRDDVPALMSAADVLVHNAGGLSFTEALVAGLPAVTYRPIPGHGRANAALLAAAGIAPWPRTPAELASAIDRAALAVTAPAAGIPLTTAAWPRDADPASVVLDMVAARTAPRARASGS